MAKRKRLNPSITPPAPGAETPPEHPEPRAMFPLGMAAPPSAPIAGVSAAQAVQAALDEVSREFARARAEGRVVLSLPLTAIETGYLARDRLAMDDEEMRALTESLRARGQQTPIEVADLGGGRFGLISGWRRCHALKMLAKESDGAGFDRVLALLRRPADSADAYLAMVEENEIRVGLSYFERARIVARSVDQGVFATRTEALRALFGTASRAKRSKIGSFLPLVAALDGVLRFPEAVSERLGLSLSKALENPAFARKLRQSLADMVPTTSEAEQAMLVSALADTRRQSQPDADDKIARTDTPHQAVEIAPGLIAEMHADGGLMLCGPAFDAGLRARLLDWLTAQA